MINRILKFGFAFVLLAITASCAQRIINLKNEMLPTKSDGSLYTKEQICDAVIAGCRKRGWSAQAREDGVVDASLIVRSCRAEVEIYYDEKMISILYKDSKNLNYHDATINADYNRWVSNLYNSIIKCLPLKS